MLSKCCIQWMWSMYINVNPFSHALVMSSVFVSSLHMLAAKCTTGAFSNRCAVRTEVCEWFCGGCNSLLAAQARGLEFDFLQLPHFSLLWISPCQTKVISSWGKMCLSLLISNWTIFHLSCCRCLGTRLVGLSPVLSCYGHLQPSVVTIYRQHAKLK